MAAPAAWAAAWITNPARFGGTKYQKPGQETDRAFFIPRHNPASLLDRRTIHRYGCLHFMSQQKFKLAGCLLAVLLAAGMLFFFNGPDDPVIQGRRLSGWISEFNIWETPQPTAAAKVLTESTPSSEKLLSNMLQARDTSFGLKVRQWLAKQKYLKFRFRTAAETQAIALGACNWLGKTVDGTTTALTAIVNDYPTRMKDRQIMDYALHTLAIMGTNGVAALVGLLDHRDTYVRSTSARLLGTIPLEGKADVAGALQRCVARGDTGQQQAAAFSLGLIKQRSTRHFSIIADETVASSASAFVRPVNLWSVDRGIEVTATSGLRSGYRGVEIFEGRTVAAEPASLVFQDSKPDGFTHFIEWKIPTLASVQSFGLLASHEGGNVKFQRAFREFRILAWDEASARFKLLHNELVTVPYGHGFYSDGMLCFRNLATPVAAQRFRLEVVQHGSGSWNGPRLIELYGFDRSLTRQFAQEALRKQDEPFRDMSPVVVNVLAE